jgi:hypothetical protein
MADPLVIASLSGGVSLAAAGIAAANGRAVTRLNDRLEREREAETKEAQAEQLRARYRDPLLSAAFDLQSRLYNIAEQRFLERYLTAGDDNSRAYAVDNSLYVIAEYLAWVEIIRREIRFLDVGEETANARWMQAMERVRNAFARDDIGDPLLRIFRGDQRAIGDLMTQREDGADRSDTDCLGYVAFVRRRSEPEFAHWFNKLEADMHDLASDPNQHRARIVALQNALVDVMDVLDPDAKRFPAERRTRLAPR